MANLSVAERKEILAKLESNLEQNTISHGEVIKTIRTELYGMTQTQYAKFIKVSDKTLRDIEKGNTDPRLSVLNKLLAPGGFKISARFIKRSI
ncbi:DNA-binding protein [Pseudoalteromonas sp. NBT06-2]|uniref:helix-turn-helix transcriptional regulator n=1 Tax=Pseudoalteromonas sp. NBT06-2 TaxID=2025950 RepID=UPI000BA78BE8|nr:helix-turn-helix transcriptional regulator [Pseudoalteromonas sp. NBT06-2]PAJ75000.1 DNA-binding protein [Pseudoalteromonas sp. NBT06-2]